MISKYRKKRIELLEIRAFTLYKTGMSLKEVGKICGDRSYEWVRRAVKKQEAKLEEPVK